MVIHSLAHSFRGVSLVTVLAASLVGCATNEPEPAASEVFVGELAAATPTSIAVLSDATTGETAIYLCDGVQTEAWLFGTRSGATIEAQSRDGSTLEATFADGRITGVVTRPGQPAAQFSASLADGVAGLYLVQHTTERADGFSASGGELHGELTSGAVEGTVESADGVIALRGSVRSFGETSGVATWIVQADGRISGRATKSTVSGTAGGGNCSAWASIKSLAFGVSCSFF